MQEARGRVGVEARGRALTRTLQRGRPPAAVPSVLYLPCHGGEGRGGCCGESRALDHRAPPSPGHSELLLNQVRFKLSKTAKEATPAAGTANSPGRTHPSGEGSCAAAGHCPVLALKSCGNAAPRIRPLLPWLPSPYYSTEPRSRQPTVSQTDTWAGEDWGVQLTWHGVELRAGAWTPKQVQPGPTRSWSGAADEGARRVGGEADPPVGHKDPRSSPSVLRACGTGSRRPSNHSIKAEAGAGHFRPNRRQEASAAGGGRADPSPLTWRWAWA